MTANTQDFIYPYIHLFLSYVHVGIRYGRCVLT